MTEQEVKNLEIIKNLIGEFAKGNLSAAMKLVVDDVNWVVCGTSPDPWVGRYTSAAQVERALKAHDDIVEIEVFRGDKYVVRDDTVVVIGYENIRFTTNNRLLGGPFAYTFVLKDEKITEALIFRDDLFVDQH